MNAIRRDEDTDNIHSIYVDQWDWEKIIPKEDRNVEYSERDGPQGVQGPEENREIHGYPTMIISKRFFRRNIFFITSQELEDLYPDLHPEGARGYHRSRSSRRCLYHADRRQAGNPASPTTDVRRTTTTGT